MLAIQRIRYCATLPIGEDAFRQFLLAHLVPMLDDRFVGGFAGFQHGHHIRVHRESGAGSVEIVGHQHGTMLGCEFFRCVRFKILRFHGETAQGLTGGFMRACPCENIGIRSEPQIDIDAPVLLDFLRRLLNRAEIADGSRP